MEDEQKTIDQSGDEDLEGHSFGAGHQPVTSRTEDAGDEDVEGHAATRPLAGQTEDEGDEEDVEGHAFRK